MGEFSVWHIVIVAVVGAFLFFGWKQLPDMARSFGRSLRVFKTEIKGLTEDDTARDSARDTVRRDTAGETARADRRPAEIEAAPRPRPTPNGRAAR